MGRRRWFFGSRLFVVLIEELRETFFEEGSDGGVFSSAYQRLKFGHAWRFGPADSRIGIKPGGWDARRDHGFGEIAPSVFLLVLRKRGDGIEPDG